MRGYALVFILNCSTVVRPAREDGDAFSLVSMPLSNQDSAAFEDLSYNIVLSHGTYAVSKPFRWKLCKHPGVMEADHHYEAAPWQVFPEMVPARIRSRHHSFGILKARKILPSRLEVFQEFSCSDW